MFGDRLLPSPWKGQLLAEGAHSLVEDVHSAINARLAAASWAPLAVTNLLQQLPSKCGSSLSASVIPVLVASVLVSTLILYIPFRWFQGIAASSLVVIFTLGLDITVSYIPGNAFESFCSPPAASASATSDLPSGVGSAIAPVPADASLIDSGSPDR